VLVVFRRVGIGMQVAAAEATVLDGFDDEDDGLRLVGHLALLPNNENSLEAALG